LAKRLLYSFKRDLKETTIVNIGHCDRLESVLFETQSCHSSDEERKKERK